MKSFAEILKEKFGSNDRPAEPPNVMDWLKGRAAEQISPVAPPLADVGGGDRDWSPAIIAMERPVCTYCGCSWIVEAYGPNSSSRCWSCRKVIEDAITHKHAPNDATGVDRPRRLLPWGA